MENVEFGICVIFRPDYFVRTVLQTKLFCSGISKSGSLKYILFCLGLKRSKKESREDALLKMYSELIERAGGNAMPGMPKNLHQIRCYEHSTLQYRSK